MALPLGWEVHGHGATVLKAEMNPKILVMQWTARRTSCAFVTAPKRSLRQASSVNADAQHARTTHLILEMG